MSNAVSKEGALQSLKLYRLQRCFSLSDDVLDVAISALEEVQQLHAIGTVSEFAELKEKATAKKVIRLDGGGYYDYKCPTCGFPGLNCLRMNYCKCGQKLDWSERKE